ncbi:MAG: hypothetical protein IKJ27_11365 [Clostridia bacterium]|nr:hypothetical protein [Clostridia bacterium]
MTGADLKKAISILYDMELNNYCVNESIKTLDWRIGNLGYEKEIKKPILDKEFLDLEIIKNIAMIAGVLGMAFGVYAAFQMGLGGFTVLVLPLCIGIGFGMFALFGAFIGLVVDIIRTIHRNSAIKKRYKAKLKAYEQEIIDDDNRVSFELEQREILVEKRNLLADRLYESQNMLADFYRRAGIDNKFRNLVAMGYMHEYISLGISNKLGGADGLYYLIMQELRWEQMQCTLDEISSKLDMIIDNQRQVYSDLKRMNRESIGMIDKLIDGIKNINSNVNDLKTIEQYNGARIAREIEFQNFMMYIR